MQRQREGSLRCTQTTRRIQRSRGYPLFWLAGLTLFIAAVFAQDSPDLRVIDRIKTEAFDHSKVMGHL